jgi:tetratricopeptide (TPR) repeat protein
MSQTQPPYYGTSPSPAPPPRPRRPSGIRRVLSSTVLLVGIIVCVLLASIGVGAFGGAIAGQKERGFHATQTTTAGLDLQFGLGLSNLEEGRYELAAQRFRWILERNPDYPSAAERLAEAERRINEAGGGTAVPTLPPSDTENPDELFAEAQSYFNDQQWENAITRLQELQALDPRYQEIEVKEMLYESLTSLGLIYIRGDRIEEGLFLLDQAAVIRPLEDQIEGERHLATLYITGRTYWGLNWPVVIQNLQVIYDTVPAYRDVAERLWEARVKYGDQLAAQGSQCGAAEQYSTALEIREDSVLQEKYETAASACAHPTLTATVTPEVTPGPTPTKTPLGNIP